MELREHQQKAFDAVNEMFEEKNKAIIVHPTGTGKTYIALKMFEKNKDKKVTFVSPSDAIVGELKAKIAKEYNVSQEQIKDIFPKLEIITYQKMNSERNKDENYLKNYDSDLVIFDEAHHTAAKEWGANAKELMDSHADTKFLGLTATPERADGKDVVKDVFEGNLADEITLEEAVATGLLKMPKYITALYLDKKKLEELEERVENLKDVNPEKYLMLKKDMEVAKNNLQKADGMPEIFEKHINEENGRYIIFCKDIEHLEKMEKTSKEEGWFDKVNSNVETLAIHSEKDDETNKHIIKRFKEDHEATENALRVLFTVEKVNEGVHFDNLSGVIMLRPTKSKIVFRQQLGRAMSIAEKQGKTSVFDIVNNIDSFEDMHEFIKKVEIIRKERNIEPDKVDEFVIIDETRPEIDILRKIEGQLESEWDNFYRRSIKWREENNGNKPKGTGKDKEEKKVYDWERYQKKTYLKQYQDKEEKDIPKEHRERVKRLKELGLVYEPYEFVTIEQKVDIMVKYISENGPEIEQNLVLEDGTPIGRYVHEIREKKRNENLDNELIEKLDSVGFIYVKRDRSNDKNINEKIDITINHIKENGTDIPKRLVLEDGTPMGRYVGDIRREYKKGSLDEAQIKQLETVGFKWVSPLAKKKQEKQQLLSEVQELKEKEKEAKELNDKVSTAVEIASKNKKYEKEGPSEI